MRTRRARSGRIWARGRRGGAALAAAVLGVAGAAAGAFGAAEAAAPGGAADAGVAVLDGRTLWRVHAAFGPPAFTEAMALEWGPDGSGRFVRKGAETDARGRPIRRSGARWIRWGDGIASPPPDAAWTDPGTDVAGWPRRRLPLFGRYGDDGRRAGAMHLAYRARFGMTDPRAAAPLRLHLAYRGGVVVYLNGREVARGHVPPAERGQDDAFVCAEAYPLKAYLRPDGAGFLRGTGRRAPPEALRDRYEARVRTLAVTLPADGLVRGTNLLAVACHRAALPKDLPMGVEFREEWHTAGLVEAHLTAPAGAAAAVRPNVGPPEGVQVWTPGPLVLPGDEETYGDPFEPVGPVRLLAPANGLASAQVVVSAKAYLPGVGAEPLPVDLPPVRGTVSDLAGPDGATLDGRRLRVRYGDLFRTTWPGARHAPGERVAGSYVPLLDAPLGGVPDQAVWLSVRVPDDARPGTYRGTLTLEGLAAPRAVPVELTVSGWRVPNPRDWPTWVNLLQSPESVAGHYGVPLWSEEHFRLLERSFEIMGECGNDVFGLLAVGWTVFGNDPAVVFRRTGDGPTDLEPDLEPAKATLSLYGRKAHPPAFLVLHVWNYGMYYRGFGRDGGDEEKRAETIPIVIRTPDGGFEDAEMPIFGAPGTARLWRAVLDGLKAHLADLGWDRTRLLLGTSGDNWPSAETVAFFKTVAPEVSWRAITHGSGVPNWGPTDADRTQPNGMVVGYCEMVRRLVSGKGHLPDHPVCCNARDCLGTNPLSYRSLAPLNVHRARYDGFCWKGVDYWSYQTAAGTVRSALNADVRFGNIVGSTPRAMAAPGDRGAIWTAQLEMLREGVQDAEAMRVVREGLADDAVRARLGAARAAACEAAVERMLDTLETAPRLGACDHRSHRRAVYAAAAEVAAAEAEGRQPD